MDISGQALTVILPLRFAGAAQLLRVVAAAAAVVAVEAGAVAAEALEALGKAIGASTDDATGC